MRKAFQLLALAGILASAACGGSSSSSVPDSGAQLEIREYEATLADGTIMVVDVDTATGTTWEGDFESVPEDGTFSANGNGTFYGTVRNRTVHATCESLGGTNFDLDGEVTSKGLRLTRSDRPGEVIQFTPVTRPLSSSRALTYFKLQTVQGSLDLASKVDTGRGSYEYQIMVGSDPGTMRFFKGGMAIVTVQLHGKGSVLLSFQGLTLADLGSKIVSSSGSVTQLGDFEIHGGQFTISS